MRRLSILLAGGAAGAFGAAVVLRRRARRRAEPFRSDSRADDLRRKLAEAREAAAEEEAFEQASAAPEATPADDLPSAPPADEFEAMRRRVHDEARAAAEEMRRAEGDPSDS